MKPFLVLMLVVAVAYPFYHLFSGIEVIVHNHTHYRYESLHTPPKQGQIPDKLPDLNLTKEDLSKCEENIANAYRGSVEDGFRYCRGYGALSLECMALDALLFITSIVALRAVRKKAMLPEGPVR